MADRSIHQQDEKPGRLELLVPRAEAAERIRKQIGLGQQLLQKYDRHDFKNLADSARVATDQWESSNLLLLRLLVNTSELSDRYLTWKEAWPSGGYHPSDAYRHWVRARLTRLEAILEHLDLIPLARSVAAEAQPRFRTDSGGSIPDTLPPTIAVKLSGKWVEELQKAILGAFRADELRQFLTTRLDRDLSHISIGGDLATVVFDVIMQSQREGWTSELLDAVAEARPQRMDLQSLVAELRSANAGGGAYLPGDEGEEHE
jgi:hypothetical protein